MWAYARGGSSPPSGISSISISRLYPSFQRSIRFSDLTKNRIGLRPFARIEALCSSFAQVPHQFNVIRPRERPRKSRLNTLRGAFRFFIAGGGVYGFIRVVQPLIRFFDFRRLYFLFYVSASLVDFIPTRVLPG